MSETPRPTTDPGERDDSAAEQQLDRRVPPADAETAPGDATRHADIHHRDPTRPPHDFLDRAAAGQ